jgi:DNA repair photolyase
MREKNITLHERRDDALRKQNMLKDSYEFPFTLNPNIGCLFACSYC